MRTLSATLTNAQQSASRLPYIELTFRSRNRVTTRTYKTTDKPNRIQKILVSEGPLGASVGSAGGRGFSGLIVLDDFDTTVGDLDFKGYRLDIGWGFGTTVSKQAPLFVYNQRRVSSRNGKLLLEFQCFSLWDLASVIWPNDAIAASLVYNKDITIRHIMQELLGGAKLEAAILGDYAAGGTVFTSYTTASENTTADDVLLLPAVPIVNDAFYYAQTSPFDRLSQDLTTVGVGTWQLTWEYWNGSTWTSLSGMTANPASGSDQDNFTLGQLKIIDFDRPTNWATVNFSTTNPDGTASNFASIFPNASLYYIRARVTSFTSITTQPKSSRIFAAQDFGVSLTLSRIDAISPPVISQLSHTFNSPGIFIGFLEAQTFTPVSDLEIDRAGLILLNEGGTTDVLVLFIRNTTSGGPSDAPTDGPDLATSTLTSAVLVANTPTMVAFNFPARFVARAGVTYALIIAVSSALVGPDQVWRYIRSDVISGGTTWSKLGAAPWLNQVDSEGNNGDFAFEIGGYPPTGADKQPDFSTDYFTDTVALIEQILLFTQMGIVVRQEGFHMIALDPAQTTLETSYDSTHAYLTNIQETMPIIPNKVTYTDRPPGAGGTPIQGSAEDTSASAAFGLITHIRDDSSILVAADATDLATKELERLKLSAATGTALVPMNVGQEIWDLVKITDAITGVAYQGRVTRITRLFEPGRYDMELTLGSVESPLWTGQGYVLAVSEQPEAPRLDIIKLAKEAREGRAAGKLEAVRQRARAMAAAGKLDIFELAREAAQIGARPKPGIEVLPLARPFLKPPGIEVLPLARPAPIVPFIRPPSRRDRPPRR